MHELLRVYVEPAKGHHQRFAAWLNRLQASGLRVDREQLRPISNAAYVWVQPDSESALSVMKEAEASGLVANWKRDWIEQHFSPEEIANAPLFQMIHVGRCIDFPMRRDHVAGISHFVEFDASESCTQCGAGARQAGPLRIPASELNKAGRFASLWISSNTFFLVSQSLAGELVQAAGGEELALTRVETLGKVRAKEVWWQFTPEHVAPLAACKEGRWIREVCKKCGAVRLHSPGNDLAVGGYYTVLATEIKKLRLPPLVLQPHWEGEIKRFDDGRLITTPSRRVWVRGDVGRFLASKKVRGLNLIPILPV